MPFPYKTVLMVGGTSGIGLALAERMIENGIFVIGVGRRRDRLDEFVAKHGSDKAAASQFDITDLKGMKAWSEQIIQQYPQLDAVILNSGIQRSLDFTRPLEIDLPRVEQEITTNYTAYLYLITYFLPHLQSLAPQPTALVAVSSGLALVPIPRCANYCATKSALHSICWTMRAQLAADEKSKHIQVIEILPPAVRTELHSQQPDLVALGMGDIGMPVDAFTDEAWEGLVEGKDEIPVGRVRERTITTDEGRRVMFEGYLKVFRKEH